MTPLIRAVLSNLIGDEDAKDIEIISNDVNVHPDGKWEIQFRHPTRCVKQGGTSCCDFFAKSDPWAQWVRPR
jgi:2-hydroxy-3-keto-5-methylthiopentenyl-1-phosphate phosphatase